MRHALLFALIAVAACDSTTVTTADARKSQDGRGAARSIQLSPTTATEAKGERLSGFPTQFKGRWAMVEADCRGDAAAKGLMTIGDKTVRFYESRGVATGLATESATKVSGAFTFDGEGQRWRKEQSFEIADGGNALVRTERDPAQSFTYMRCK